MRGFGGDLVLCVKQSFSQIIVGSTFKKRHFNGSLMFNKYNFCTKCAVVQHLKNGFNKVFVSFQFFLQSLDPL